MTGFARPALRVVVKSTNGPNIDIDGSRVNILKALHRYKGVPGDEDV
jgi:hypothetical protein